jgi:hydrogenase nickel incorporation protein HypA/HybF
MHEMSISESILGIIEEEGRRRRYSRVRRVRLEIGPFAGIETEALRFSFDVVTRGTLAEDSVLEIIETQAQAWCLPCEQTVSIRQRYDACPVCGSHQLQVTAGEELRIKDLEVD